MAWVEAIGPWSHFIAEREANEAIETPRIADGVKSVENALGEETWLIPGAVEQGDAPPPKMTASPVFAGTGPPAADMDDEADTDAINSDLMEASAVEEGMELADEEMRVIFMPPDLSDLEDDEEEENL